MQRRRSRKAIAVGIGLSAVMVAGVVGMNAAMAAGNTVRRYIDAGNTGTPIAISGTRTWEPQTGFTGGKAGLVSGTTGAGITADVARTVLTDPTAFTLAVPNGSYRVTIWAYAPASGKATYTVEEVNAAVPPASSRSRLRSVTSRVTVNDGSLDIRFATANKGLKVAALAIVGRSSTAAPVPAPNPTPAPTPTPAGTAPPSTAPSTGTGATTAGFMNAGGPPNRGDFGVATADEPGEWNIECGLSHQAMDDPILFPGLPGASHMHSFYGNASTNASSTTESLMASPSDCNRGMSNTDHSAYWVPSLMTKNGTPAKNDQMIMWAYYRRGGEGNGPKVSQTFPNGLHMIAGDSKATSPQARGTTQWQCGFGGDYFDHMPNCKTEGNGDELHAIIPFPNCWNGKDLDTPTHTGHVAYSAIDGTCPTGYPVVLPSLWYDVDFPGITDGSQYTLASGGIYSWHADFIAAWDLQAQRALIANCLNSPHVCEDIKRNGNMMEPGDNGSVPAFDITKY